MHCHVSHPPTHPFNKYHPFIFQCHLKWELSPWEEPIYGQGIQSSHEPRHTGIRTWADAGMETNFSYSTASSSHCQCHTPLYLPSHTQQLPHATVISWQEPLWGIFAIIPSLYFGKPQITCCGCYSTFASLCCFPAVVWLRSLIREQPWPKIPEKIIIKKKEPEKHFYTF